MATNNIEQLRRPDCDEHGSESREQSIAVDRIEPVDLNRIRGLQAILKMFKENRDHLEGITAETTIFDLNRYYSESQRHGFVGISDKEGLVGVYDLSGPKIRNTRRGGQDVVLTLGLLNRMCVRIDLQGRGIGGQLTKDAIRRTHEEYEWLNLLGGIVLDEQHTQRIQRARSQDEPKRETIFRELFEQLKLKDGEGGDARVRLFVVRNGFQYAGFHPNVTVGEQVREVLLISHPHPGLILPQSEGK